MADVTVSTISVGIDTAPLKAASAEYAALIKIVKEAEEALAQAAFQAENVKPNAAAIKAGASEMDKLAKVAKEAAAALEQHNKQQAALGKIAKEADSALAAFNKDLGGTAAAGTAAEAALKKVEVLPGRIAKAATSAKVEMTALGTETQKVARQVETASKQMAAPIGGLMADIPKADRATAATLMRMGLSYEVAVATMIKAKEKLAKAGGATPGGPSGPTITPPNDDGFLGQQLIGSTIAGGIAQITGLPMLFGRSEVAAMALGSAIGVVATGLVGATAAAVYFATKFNDSQRNIERSLLGMGRLSGATTDDINKAAEAAARAGRMSIDASREIAATLAGSGVDKSFLPGAPGTVRDLAAQRQIPIEKATQLFGTIATDPIKGLEELESQFGALDAATRNFILTADKLPASARLIAELGKLLRPAETNMSWFDIEIDRFKRDIADLGNLVGSIFGDETLRTKIDGLKMAVTDPSLTKAETEAFKAQLEILEKRAAELERGAKAQQESLKIAEATKRVDAEIDAINPTRRRSAQLNRQIGDAQIAAGDVTNPRRTEAQEWLVALTSTLEALRTPLQQVTLEHTLSIQAIRARTLAERADIEATRAKVLALQDVTRAGNADLFATQARARVMEEAAKAGEEMFKRLRLDVANLGASPYDAQINRSREELKQYREQYTVPGTTSPAGDAPRPPREMMSPTPETGETKIKDLWPDVTRMFKSVDEAVQRIDSVTNPLLKSRMEALTAEDSRKRAYGDWEREPAPKRREPAQEITVGPSAAPRRAPAAEDYGSLIAKRDAYNFQQAPIDNANRDLLLQNQLLDTQFASLGKSAAETARLAAEQQLLSRFMRDGTPVTAEMSEQIKQYGIDAAATQERLEELSKIQRNISELKGIPTQAITGLFTEMRAGLASGKKGWEAVGDAAVKQLDRIVMKLVDMKLNQWLSGIGGGDLFGLGKLLGLTGMPTGAGGSGGTPGFAGGGQVRGAGTGTSDSILARLSDGEFVVKADRTRMFLPLLERLNFGPLPGYAAGGMVRAPSISALTNAMSTSSDSRSPVNIVISGDAGAAEISTDNQPPGVDMTIAIASLEKRMAPRVASRTGALGQAAVQAQRPGTGIG